MKNYLGILALVALAACTSETKKVTDTSAVPVATASEKAKGSPVFKDQKVAGIYTDYLRLKDALVASNSNSAKSAAQALEGELRNYTGCENTSVIAQKIVASKDIVAQRKEFTDLSADVIALFKHADLSAGAIYVQHCPMANNGDGGDWLASEKKIQNPYYGSAMLECGAVVTEIKAK